LNGLWDVEITSNDVVDVNNVSWNEKILVPFSVETRLSGINREVKIDEAIFYHRKLKIDQNWKGKAILLHFDASDYKTTVWLNGKLRDT
tara:strand:+ start:34803 stop:35069 length:267 start_codon:yes stop_codon:yes gene_type:complete